MKKTVLTTAALERVGFSAQQCTPLCQQHQRRPTRTLSPDERSSAGNLGRLSRPSCVSPLCGLRECGTFHPCQLLVCKCLVKSEIVRVTQTQTGIQALYWKGSHSGKYSVKTETKTTAIQPVITSEMGSWTIAEKQLTHCS